MEIPPVQRQRITTNVKLSHPPFPKLNLLQLPVEILMMITRFLIAPCPQQYGCTSLHRPDDITTLFSLSRVHTQLRWICIALGLFRCVIPRNKEAFKLDDNSSLSYALFPCALSSLGINLGEQSLWKICGN